MVADFVIGAALDLNGNEHNLVPQANGVAFKLLILVLVRAIKSTSSGYEI